MNHVDDCLTPRIQQPALLENATRQSGQLPAIARPSISAVLVTLEHPSDAKAVAEVIGGWTDVTVYTADEQRNLLLKGSVEKVRSQIGLFRILLTIIATIIMALILYTLTLDKLHSIALLKLIGASNSVLLGLISTAGVDSRSQRIRDRLYRWPADISQISPPRDHHQRRLDPARDYRFRYLHCLERSRCLESDGGFAQ